MALGIDINYDACLLSQKFSQEFNLNEINIINMNILKGIHTRFLNSFDVIICNPPYVPTE